MSFRVRQRDSRGLIDIGPVEDSDWPAIMTLLDQPMEGELRLAMARHPDPRIAAAIEGERHTTVVGRDPRTGRVVGLGSRSVRPVWLNGRVTRVGYLGQLRHRGELRTVGLLLRRGFAQLDAARRCDEAPFDYTSIMAGNRRARRLLEADLPGLPRYRQIGRMQTLVFRPQDRQESSRYRVGAASGDDLAEVAHCLERNHRRCQFAPVWSERTLRDPSLCRGLKPADLVLIEERGRITGVAALWDQRGFKQIRLHGYAPRLARWRPFLNLAQSCRGGPMLPGPGDLALGFVSHLAVDDNDLSRACALLAEVRRQARKRGLALLALGLGTDHPLLSPLRATLRAYALESVIYQVHREPPADRQSGEPACLSIPGYPLHAEIAVL